jgi:hypothetical protein
MGLAIVVMVCGYVMPVAAQQPGGAWPSQAVSPPAAGGPRDATTGGSSNMTVVPRSAPDKGGSSTGDITFVAFLTDDGQRIDQGLVWRVYPDQSGTNDAKPKLIGTWRDASPAVKLPPGNYIVNAAFGRAHLTRKIKVEAGVAAQERFVLNAGGLRVTAMVGSETAPDRSVSYDILSGDTDQLGNRTRIMSNARPGVIVRLNAGIYHIISTYGDANAVVKADVTVEAGKLTEATINHQGARVTFKLVTRTGGEAQADTQWSVQNANGESVKESVGALPTHILEPGSYVVNAKHGGRSFQRSFTVRANEAAQIEVVMQ